MPELPEVEVVKLGLDKKIPGKKLHYSKFYRKDLRDKIPTLKINRLCKDQIVRSVSRRGKYLILHFDESEVLIHFGMSGKLITSKSQVPKAPHTHWVFGVGTSKNTTYFHFICPRRFGRIALHTNLSAIHPLLKNLGTEPLSHPKLGDYLHTMALGKKKPIKNFVMDSNIVVGVGNIYASESLHQTGVHPCTPAGQVSLDFYKALAKNIKTTLKKAIRAGGTTLQDHRQLNGNPGYFRVELAVYGRDSEPCTTCSTPIENIRMGGRSSYFCSECQPLP